MDLSLAIVRDNADPSGMGRLRVALIASPESAEMWALIVSPFAGDGRGLFLAPEIGDEVLVGFLNGNTRSPVILGSLWSGRSPPPTNNPRERVLRSADGHRISLVDSGDSEQRALVIEDAHGSRVEMRQGRMLIRAEGRLEIEGADVTVNGRPL